MHHAFDLCNSNENNGAVWKGIASNGGDILFDISRSHFTGSRANIDFTEFANHYGNIILFPRHIRSSGTLDEPGVLDGIRTLVVPAPGGGANHRSEPSSEILLLAETV